MRARLNFFFMILVLPYLAVRRTFRLLFGNVKNYQIFHQAQLDSTLDYLERIGTPALVRSWIDVRTRFAFEKPVAQTVLRVRGRTFIDIGANMGYYTALLSENFQNILAFEPHPGNVEMLRSTVSTGGLRNVTIRNEGVSDVDGVTRLYVHKKRVEHSIEREGEGGEAVAARMVRLDSFVKDIVDLVKVDVEGAEWKVIRGAEQSIRNGRILRWVIEVDDERSKEKLESHMRERKYETRWLDGRHLFASLKAHG